MSEAESEARTKVIGGIIGLVILLLWFGSIFTTIVFTVLKLSGAITWTWLWVTSPLWMVAGAGTLLGVLLILAVLGLSVLALWISHNRRKKREAAHD